MSAPLLDSLDRKIVGALQVDGRAGWSTIADAIGAPERTVTRRGSVLLADGIVRVRGVAPRGSSMVVRVTCTPGSSPLTARALAARTDTTFTYLVTGVSDCVAEVITPRERGGQFLLEDLPAVPGVVSVITAPVLKYFRTIHQWQPGLLTPAEKEMLGAITPPRTPPHQADRPSTTAQDRAIIAALLDDGRLKSTDVARRVGVSEATARRRIEALRREGQVYIRAVVDPRVLGYETSAMLWIRTPPAQIEKTAEALVQSPHVRYAAALMGNEQIVAEVVLPSLSGAYEFTTSAPWSESALGVEASLVIRPLKTSGVVWE